MKLGISDWAKKLLILLLATDIVFILIHIAYLLTLKFSGSANALLSIETDGGYGEIFQYIKEFWIVLILGFFAIKQRSVLFLGWSLLFTFLLLDDSLRVHEQLGLLFSEKVNFTILGIRARGVGEFVVSAGMGLLLFGMIAGAYRVGKPSERKISKRLIVLLLGLALSGILVDLLHVAITLPVINPALGILEDGAEHGIMSVITSFVFNLLSSEETVRQQPQLAEEVVLMGKNGNLYYED